MHASSSLHASSSKMPVMRAAELLMQGQMLQNNCEHQYSYLQGSIEICNLARPCPHAFALSSLDNLHRKPHT